MIFMQTSRRWGLVPREEEKETIYGRLRGWLRCSIKHGKTRFKSTRNEDEGVLCVVLRVELSGKVGEKSRWILCGRRNHRYSGRK